MDENQTIDQDRIIKINIEEEMKSSYIDYSMSVIVARALPDVRDGFKPVHRRILYGMLGIGREAEIAVSWDGTTALQPVLRYKIRNVFWYSEAETAWQLASF